ncbi:type IX secretion system membrane protein PorP/SprF [Sabulilitoribacter multivorans]|uniref:Type IX secretion system membrane protein PorP/SprF n=1 Tax=Flaviramulus multivorans TaxID=1304750 RepID=A0ABS9IET9_9FLAO|nr:type IX secretion system membrane protein PorP/SprF [Flaviramulus multivorans]MCF7559302.1 type IX secretion system membrane protein PorP/SprF [Flaviramulus multivorans]
MKIIKNNFVLLILLTGSIAFAQQLPQFTQYMFNTISINPAYAGSRETLSVVGLHRSQWVGVSRGPTTQTLSAHSPLRNENMGLGFSFINDKLGFEKFNYAYVDFSYTIHTSQNTKLSFGLKGGFTHYQLDDVFLNNTQVTSDPFFGNYANKWNPNVGVGLLLHTDKWYMGLSAPRILNTDLNLTEGNANVEYVALERINYYFTGGYVFDLSENTKLKPSFLVKGTNGAPISFDLNANFLFNEKFWLGGSYRYNENTASIGAIADFQVSRDIRIGYAYDHYISEVRPYFGGTHEVLLIFEAFNEKRKKSPRYF